MSLPKQLHDHQWLWPDASMAPEVPSDAVLRLYAHDPDSLPADLVAQVADSLACQRRLAKLARQDLITGAADLLPSVPAQVLRSLPATPRGDPVHHQEAPAPWQLRHTLGTLQVFDAQKNLLRPRWSFDPVPVLVLSALSAGPYGQRLVRAIPLSPAETMASEFLADDELVLTDDTGEEWVVHAWLNYPVHEDQLGPPIARVPEAVQPELDACLQAVREGLPLSAEERAGLCPDLDADEEWRRHRAQVMARAATLSATCDARVAWCAHLAATLTRHPATQRAAAPAAWSQLRLASTSAAPRQPASQRFAVSGLPGTYLRLLAPFGDPPSVGVLVENAAGELVTTLAGAWLLSADGQLAEPITGDQARVPLALVAQGFCLSSATGQPLSLQLESEP